MEQFPLSKGPVKDGATYRGIDFQLQLDIAAQDAFVAVLTLPPLYEEWRTAFAQAEASLSQYLKTCNSTTLFKMGITRGPALRFHTCEDGVNKRSYNG
jgi:hypothetical protein